MDIFLERRVSPHLFIKKVREQLPRGIDVSEVVEVAIDSPSLQSQVRSAEYKVTAETGRGPKEVEAAICSLLASDRLPWQHARDKEFRKYDLRNLIDDLWLIESCPPEYTIGMILRCDSTGTGRPEQVLSALGFTEQPKSIHRVKLLLERQAKSAACRKM
jgi:radical SAM-linked protein